MQPLPPVSAPMVISTTQTSQRKEHYMSKAVLGLSITQVIIGILCILLQVALIGLRSPIHFVGQGFWTGLFFILTGSFGIVSSKRKTICFIVTFLVLAIFSAVITIGILTISPQEILVSQYCFYAYTYDGCERHAVIGVDAVLITLAVLQAIVAIISSGFGCHGICGGNQIQAMVMTGQVQHIPGPDGQLQMVIVPFNQQGEDLPGGPQLPAYNQTAPPSYRNEEKVPIPE